VVTCVLIANMYNGVQTPVLLLALATLILSYVADNTRLGRYCYAAGRNSAATMRPPACWATADSSFSWSLLMGLMSGIAGAMLASYVGYGSIAAGTGYELDAIASAILGGTSPLGGMATILGALIGALIMSSLSNDLQLLNVQPAWQYVLKGVVLVLAVLVDVSFKKK